MYLTDNSLIKIAITDDHNLYREALSSEINRWEQCKVMLQAANGRELLERLNDKNLPHILITDMQMPEMNGYETIKAVHNKFPDIKILVVSQFQSEEMLALLIQYGAHGFVHKADDIQHLKTAVKALLKNGYYFTHHAATRMLKKTMDNKNPEPVNNLSEEQLNFLQYLCRGLTYKEIACIMNTTERHIEYIRQQICVQLDETNSAKLMVTAMQKGLAI